MALFEDEEFTEEGAENNYLIDPEKGLELVRSMILRQKSRPGDISFDTIIKQKLFPTLAELGLKREAEIYSQLNKLSDKLKDGEKLRLLYQKKVVGIGGKFSAGKSCFINSLTNSTLPEGQRPTTSIATYIVHADAKKNVAITNNDNLIELDDEAIAAITHQFFEQYHIGFSRLIKNLIVYTDDFPYQNIAILDTPGYSKADTGKDSDGTDAELARDQLRSVDHLIWLVDSVQGVITERDIEFISTLNLSTEILVVFTKADLVIKEDLEKKIEQAKITLSNLNKKIFGVIAYDSFNKEIVVGDNELNDFMELANGSGHSQEDIRYQLSSLNEILLNNIKDSITESRRKMDQCSAVLESSSNVEHISSVLDEYSKSYASVQKLKESRGKLSENFSQLYDISDSMARSTAFNFLKFRTIFRKSVTGGKK